MWKKIAGGSTCYVPYQSSNTIKKKMNTLFQMFKTACYYKDRSQPSNKTALFHQQKLESTLKKLFDISKPDIEKNLKPEDYLFVKNQQGPHSFTFGTLDKASVKRNIRKISREESVEQRKESAKSTCLSQTITVSSIEGMQSTSGTETSTSTDEEERLLKRKALGSRPEYIPLEVPRRLAAAPQVVLAADRNKLSNNALTEVLSAVILESNGDLDDFVLSGSTTLRSRKKADDAQTACALLCSIKSSGGSYIPRDDYEELLNLSLYYIQKESVETFTFRRPGAHHRARCMSTAIYSLKMLLLQDQLQLKPDLLAKLEKFGYFVAVLYAPNWFRSPIAPEAAFIDLSLYKRLLQYKEVDSLKQIAEAAIAALTRHLWYLTEELVPFALCSKNLAQNLKETLASKLLQIYQEFCSCPLPPQKPTFPKISL